MSYSRRQQSSTVFAQQSGSLAVQIRFTPLPIETYTNLALAVSIFAKIASVICGVEAAPFAIALGPPEMPIMS